MPTRSEKIAADISALLRARTPLLWIVTREEARVEALLFEAAASAGYLARTWDVAAGAQTIAGQSIQGGQGPDDCMRLIDQSAKGGSDRFAWIMRDLPPWLAGPIGMVNCRTLRNLARSLPSAPRDRAQAVIVLTPSAVVPEELQGHATVINWPLPDREEIAAIFDAAIAGLPESDKDGNPIRANAAPNGTREAGIDAAVGLTGEEAANCYAKSLISLRKIDPAAVAQEKRRVIAREKVLEWFEPLAGGIEAVGGLDLLKDWLKSRSNAYSPEARAYGLPAPKGALLVGVPGCGKSLTAKAIATAWGVPLLRLDLGALKSKYVGESEGNLRKAFQIIEALGRCVVWLDEIEKALAGAVQGGADGGVSTDALGAILSWMQERQGEAFVIATANDVSALPPELLRKGRFDELWFIDLPTPSERTAVLRAALKAHGREESSNLDVALIEDATQGFTGAEIAALVPDALYTAFADGAREPTHMDLKTAARSIVPLSETAKDKIDALRAWAKTKARPASLNELEKATGPRLRALDI